ncbi:hypothetical protein R1flu_011864 [Riccia fluitans]|uniref:DUF4283 domain-containing protein n=1 Tax=Riccia fluitans TaxID=41844 RepID=A0ABD1Z8Z9_9MARC
MRLWVKISQVTALSRREFLVVFESLKDRKVVLSRLLGFLDGKAVRMVEWEKQNLIKLAVNMKVAWVELWDLSPFLEDQVGSLLEAIGPVVSHLLERQSGLRQGPLGDGLRSSGWRTVWKRLVIGRTNNSDKNNSAKLNLQRTPECDVLGKKSSRQEQSKNLLAALVEILDDNLVNTLPVEGRELGVQGSARPTGSDCSRIARGSQQHVGGANWVHQEDCGTVLEDARKIQMATEGEFLSEEVNSVDDEKAESSLVKSSNKGGLVRNFRAKQSIVFRSLDWLDAPFEREIEENMKGDGGDRLKDCRQILGELDSNGREAERSGSERDVNLEDKIGRRWGEEGLKQVRKVLKKLSQQDVGSKDKENRPASQ